MAFSCQQFKMCSYLNICILIQSLLGVVAWAVPAPADHCEHLNPFELKSEWSWRKSVGMSGFVCCIK